MELFLDTADVGQIERWLGFGVIDGVTTNPSIMLKDGAYDMEARTREIAKLIAPRPLSAEVTTNDHDEMIEQAREFASWASNIVVKIPILNEHGDSSLGVIHRLSEAGLSINATACLSFGQAAMATKAGATYVSIFAGRVADEGNDPSRLIGQFVDWVGRWGYPTKLICGSVRMASNIQDWALAGAHIITVPPPQLEKFIDHQYSRVTVKGFNADARAALEKMRQLQEIAAREQEQPAAAPPRGGNPAPRGRLR